MVNKCFATVGVSLVLCCSGTYSMMPQAHKQMVEEEKGGRGLEQLFAMNQLAGGISFTQGMLCNLGNASSQERNCIYSKVCDVERKVDELGKVVDGLAKELKCLRTNALQSGVVLKGGSVKKKTWTEEGKGVNEKELLFLPKFKKVSKIQERTARMGGNGCTVTSVTSPPRQLWNTYLILDTRMSPGFRSSAGGYVTVLCAVVVEFSSFR